MPTIVNSATFNPAALQADDLYIVIQPPPSFIAGVPSDVFGVVGTASWGPKNTPILLGSPADGSAAFGPMTLESATDPHDMPTDLVLAFAQASGGRGSLQGYGVRVTDGTDVAATVQLKDVATPTAANGLEVDALYSGKQGNNIQVVISTGGNTNSWTVTVVGFIGSTAEVYPNIPTAGFWAALKNAFANGLSGVRGPSQLVRGGTVGASTLAPATGTFTLTGGTDGRAVTTANLTGSDTTVPKTGMYALRSLIPAVGVAWIAGLTDSTAYSAFAALCDGEGMLGLLTFTTGTDSQGVVTAKKGYGILSFNIAFFKDWLYFFDPVNNITRLVPPLAVAGGGISVLRPSVSPSNKQVYGISGTERYNTTTGAIIAYSTSEVGLLESSGINVISNPIPGGPTFGFRMGVNSSNDPVTSPIEYGRMTNWLAQSYLQFMGQVVGQLQSTRPDDPLRSSVKLMLDGFHQILKDNLMIDDYQDICGFQQSGSAQAGYNTPTTIAQHYLFALAKVRYLASVKFFILALLGGTTVVTTANSLDEALIAQQGV